GGLVVSTSGVIGGGNSTATSNNMATVSGSGSLWVNSGILAVGNAASANGNSLSILNSGVVSSVGGRIGNTGFSNSVTLANGAIWNLNSSGLVWGAGATIGNTLTVDSASWITNAVGLSLNDAGRTVYLTNQTINGGNIAFSGGALNIGTGPNTAPSALVMSNYTLNASGNAIGGASIIGNGCSNTTVSLLSGYLWNGGNQTLTVGSGAGATNNTLLIDGQGVTGGAIATNMSTVTVCGGGSLGNTLIVTNRGQLAALGVTVGFGMKGRALVNEASMTLGTSGISLSGDLGEFQIGSNGVVNTTGAINFSTGASNTLSVINGGRLTIIGATPTPMRNLTSYQTIRVAGDGSVFDGGGNIYSIIYWSSGVGQFGNQVIVANGGVLTNITLRMHIQNNSPPVCAGNLVAVTNGGRFYSSGDFSLNNKASSPLVCNNTALVAGVSSVWNNGNYPFGLSSGSNHMLLVEGGLLTNVSTLTFSTGRNNMIVVTNGGRVFTGGTASLGSTAGDSQNAAIVTGSGSLWSLGNQTLIVGATNSSNNSLTIDQGGTVDNIGTLTLAGALNSVSLRGGTLGVANTVYTNGPFTVGDGTQSATLKVLAGGTLAFNSGLLITNNATLTGVGTVNAGTAGVLITNGATINPGINGAGTLTIGGSNLTWAGGGVYDCEITNLSLGFGSGWDLLNVSSQLVFAGGTPKFVIKMDSKGAPVSGFDPALNYSLKIVNYGSMTGYDTNLITIDATSAFNPLGYVWTLANTNNALWLVYSGTNSAGDATRVWKVPSNGNWNVDGNWAGGVAPASGGDQTNILNFGDNGTPYISSNNLSGTFLLNKLELVNISGVTNVIRGNPLAFTNNGEALARVEYQSGGGVFVVSNAISLAAGTVFGGEGAGILVLASNVTGGQPLIKQGPWTLALAGSNTFENPVVVTNASAGVIRIANSDALSRNTIIVTNGGVLNGTVAYTLGNLDVLRSARVTGSGSLWSNSAALTVGSNAPVTVDNGGQLLLVGGMTLNGYGSSPMTVTNGGQLNFSNTVTVGSSSASNAWLVTDSGSLLQGPGNDTAYLNVGGAAMLRNTLTVQNGGIVTNMRLALLGPSTLTVANGGRCQPRGLYLDGTECSASVMGGAGVTSIISGPVNGVGLRGKSVTVTIDGADVAGSALLDGNASIGVGVANCMLILTNKGRWVGPSTGGGIVGYNGPSNSLVLAKGGYCKIVTKTDGVGLGYGGNGANYNSIVVRDSGSVFEIVNGSYGFYIGCAFGANINYGNMIYVQEGGMITNADRVGFAGDTSRSYFCGSNSFNNGIQVSAGGLINAGNLWGIGEAGGVTGNFAKVTGAGSIWNMNNKTLTVGATNGVNSNNYFTIEQGGVLDNVGTLLVSMNNSLNLLGGALGVINMTYSNGLPFLAGDGTQTATLKAQGGTLNFPSGLVITNNANLTGTGIIAATTTVYGTVSPGLLIGVITNSGDLILKSSATTKIEIATNSTAGTGWDLLTVTNGTLNLGGTLKVVLTGGFTPLNAQSFVVM
ncbi:MAG: hypothetical protein WCL16_10060, partial [bacterium]